MGTVKDRTAELHAAIESMLQRGGRGSTTTLERSRLMEKGSAWNSSSGVVSRSDFARKAAYINQEILSMSTSLHRLAQLARKKSLFDDQPTEINRLIQVVKLKIPEISRLIVELSNARQELSAASATALSGSTPPRTNSARNRQVDEHSANVITSLQAKLATSSNEFKSILEVRTQAMRDQKSRRDQYSAAQVPASAPPNLTAYSLFPSTSSSGSSNSRNQSSAGLSTGGPLTRVAVGQAMASLGGLTNAGGSLGSTSGRGTSPHMSPPSSNFRESTASSLFTPVTSSQSPLYNPENNSRNHSSSGAPTGPDFVVDLGGQQQQQMMFVGGVAANQEYIESRAQAIESIESTIAELGQIYSHFAQVLSQQREMIQRIDDNIVDVEMNVTGAHDQLVRYFQNISSNRWLMIRVFAVLVVFFLLFVLIT